MNTMNEIFVTVIGLILTSAISVLAFWLKKFVCQVEKQGEILQRIEREFSRNSGTCEEKHKGIEARLKKHGEEIEELSDKVSDHNTRISILEKIKT